jgi:formate dehydrogenase subunit delta
MEPNAMSHDEENPGAGIAKIVRMANQIGTFFESKPHDMGVEGVAEHINKFWEPRMRRHFFEVFDAGGEGMLQIVKEAAAKVRRPDAPVSADQAAQANAGVPGDKGEASGETKSRIAASQG